MAEFRSLESFAQMLTVVGKALLPSRAVSVRFAYYQKLFRTIAAAGVDVLYALRTATRDAHPLTARGPAQDQWLGLYDMPRRGATQSSKGAALRIRGAAGATFETTDTLTHLPTGQKYRVIADGSIPLVAPFWFDAGVESIGVGSATKLSKGTELTFDNPPATIKATAELQKDLDDGGWDVEPDGAALVRLKARLSGFRSRGNDQDFIALARSVPGLGIVNAYVYAGRPAIGHVDIAALRAGSGGARVLSAPDRATLLAYLVSQSPSQLSAGGLRVLETVPEPVSVVLYVIADRWDFEDSGGLGVSSYDAGSREVTMSDDLPPSFGPGARFAPVGAGFKGEHYVVDALTGSNTFVLRDEPAAALTGSTEIFAQGDASIAARAAIVAHLDGEDLYAGPDGPITIAAAAEDSTIDLSTLRPLVAGVGTANPNGRYDIDGVPWIGGLYPDKISAIASYVPGVQRIGEMSPSETIEAPDYLPPNDAKVGMIYPAGVLVRKYTP